MILLIPGIIVTIWAQSKVQSTFKKYSKEWSSNNYT
ncbi:MAG: zinc metallopeptidase, partial [Clostridia bacterium]|nr:zinc metallopeptidase [Clostridia bacterium]